MLTLRPAAHTVSTGDSITTNVTVTSSSGGIVTMRNNSRGSAIVATVTGATGSDIIQGTSAEWIVEDLESGSSLVVFPAFPTSSFTGASAIESGTSVSPPAGTTIDLVQGVELCSATISGTTVSVRDS